MKYFWDIESYENLFLCSFIDENDFLEVHYLVEKPSDEKEIERACKDSGYKYKLYNLKENAWRLLEHFKRTPPSDGQPTLLSEFLGIEEKKVEKRTDWYYAYNSIHYDIQMIAFLEKAVLSGRLQTSTQSLRRHSNSIIQDIARKENTASFERYGNQVDVARIIDALIQDGKLIMGLKTIVGIRGGSIIESEANKTGVSKDIYGDTLYNINDIVEMRDEVYAGKLQTEEGTFQNLLDTYDTLSQYGITKNSTSAKFVEYVVSPHGPIDDIPVVDFTYPALHVAKEKGVKQQDMLERTKDWYMENVYNVVRQHNPKAALKHLVKFQSIYNFYASMRGRNWNSSSRHVMDCGIQPEQRTARNELFQNWGTYLPFIDKYGNDTGTYGNFSLGGFHGAEINMEQLEQDRQAVKHLKETYGKISMIPKGVVPAALLNIIKTQSRTQYGEYPVQFSHEIPMLYVRTEMVDDILDPEDLSPFQVDDKTLKEKLLSRYATSSQGDMIHQDFAGYYPMLMINLGVFYDGNGKDVYNEIYKLRISIKKQLKSHPFGSDEWKRLNTIQEGLKLILNSASGVLDGSHDTNLRANNKCLVMRSLGQLFTWLIAQALALEGARIPSSNTDGIYVTNISPELNKEIVDRELEPLLVDIDPEEIYLVSKDTNNRLEMEHGKIISARGGMLSAYEGARIDKRLAHPALIDAVLALYLTKADILQPTVDENLVRQCLHEYWESIDKRKAVLMASWVMRSSSGSIFVDNEDNVYPGTIRTWLTHNGVKLDRYVVAKKPRGATLDAFADELFSSSYLGAPDVLERLSTLNALSYFTHAITVEEYQNSEDRSVSVISKSKIGGLPETTFCHIDNRSINKLPESEIETIFSMIDENAYIDMIIESADSWHRKVLPSLLK